MYKDSFTIIIVFEYDKWSWSLTRFIRKKTLTFAIILYYTLLQLSISIYKWCIFCRTGTKTIFRLVILADGFYALLGFRLRFELVDDVNYYVCARFAHLRESHIFARGIITLNHSSNLLLIWPWNVTKCTI